MSHVCTLAIVFQTNQLKNLNNLQNLLLPVVGDCAMLLGIKSSIILNWE